MSRTVPSRRRPVARPWFAVTLACLSPSASPLRATTDLLGGTIVANLKLDHDVIRTDPGLFVGAGGITLNLNGQTISGSSTTIGSGFGTSVIGRTKVSIRGGTVSNFEAGVRVMTPRTR